MYIIFLERRSTKTKCFTSLQFHRKRFAIIARNVKGKDIINGMPY
jgi:hypothetical protein